MIKPIFRQSKWLASLIILLVASFLIGGCIITNQLPIISSLIANNEGEINPGDSFQIECIASDPDGDELSYTWTASGGTISSESPVATWVAPNIIGTYTIMVEVNDSRDGIATDQLTIEVLAPNNPPVIESLTAEWERVEKASNTPITCIALDPDGDELSYTWAAFGGTISGEGSTAIWTAPNVPGTYTIRIEVNDGRDSIVTEQLTIEVLAPNHPPIISSLIANNESEINLGDSFQIECIASDPDGDELSYTWAAFGSTLSGEGPVVSWTAPDVPGTYTISVEVSDGRDGIATEQLTIDVLTPNSPPVISRLTTDCPRVRPTRTAIIECIVQDPDGDELAYIWTAYSGTILGEGPTVSWIAPNEYGTYTITVTVTDGEGGEVSESISIIVCGCGSAC